MDRRQLRRLIVTAQAAGIPTSPAVLARLDRVDQLAAEVVGDDLLAVHRQQVAREVADRVLADQDPSFVEAWCDSVGAATLDAYRARGVAVDLALRVLTAEALGEIRPALSRVWQAATADVATAYGTLGGDTSVGNALAHSKAAQQGCDAVVRLRQLVELTDQIITAGAPAGRPRDWLGAGAALSPDHGIDWATEALELLGVVGAVLVEVEAPLDPIEARYAHRREDVPA